MERLGGVLGRLRAKTKRIETSWARFEVSCVKRGARHAAPLGPRERTISNEEGTLGTWTHLVHGNSRPYSRNCGGPSGDHA